VSQRDADLTAARVLQRLVELEGIEFVSSHGFSVVASSVSVYLRHTRYATNGSVFALWLMEIKEVRDLYLDDDQLEAVLREVLATHDDDDPAPTIEARRPELEALLCDEPDKLEHRLVYADWLQGEHDPFGELIACQCAAAREPDNPTLERAAAATLAELTPALLGPLAEYLGSVVRLEWRCGFIEVATLGKSVDDHEPYEGAILLRWLLDHRAAMLLRELELRPIEHRQQDQYREMLAVLLERPRPLLRRLAIGDEAPLLAGEAGVLARLDELLPNLETLELRVRSVELDGLRHPRLRRLVWEGPLQQPRAAAWASFELPQLESLELGWLGGFELEPILATLELPSLRSLQVPGTAISVEWLARVAWRANLEHLDLSAGTLTDEHARLLARLPWPSLRSLDVSNNRLGAEGIALLTDLAPTVVIGAQRGAELDGDEVDEEDDEYYDSAME
jgi:uncharacterized protein (TIGR02996 family)